MPREINPVFCNHHLNYGVKVSSFAIFLVKRSSKDFFMEREINWFVDRLIEEYPFLKEKRDFLKTRIIWGMPKGFVYWWGDHLGPYGGILIRPVNDTLVTQGTFDYWSNFWEFDLNGDICWIDYAYGPGLYPKMIGLCRSTGCPRLGWRHRDRMHIRPMNRMPAKSMKMAFHI